MKLDRSDNTSFPTSQPTADVWSQLAPTNVIFGTAQSHHATFHAGLISVLKEFGIPQEVGRRAYKDLWTTRRTTERAYGRRNKNMKEWRKEITHFHTHFQQLPFLCTQPREEAGQGVCTSDVCSALVQHSAHIWTKVCSLPQWRLFSRYKVIFPCYLRPVWNQEIARKNVHIANVGPT